MSNDNVNNPKHYKIMAGVEAIDVIQATLTEEQYLGFCLGNVLKYKLRAGQKGDPSEDLSKAVKYIELYESRI